MKKSFPITATFIDEISMDIGSENFSIKEWKKELKTMKSVGIDTIVFIRGGMQDRNKCIYPSKVFPTYFDEENDFLGNMLKMAEKLKIKVFIGLYMATGNWNNGNYQEMTEQNRIFIDEIMERYSKYMNNIHWYIPTEVCRDEFNIIPTLENLIKLINEKTPGKKILLSPLYRTRVLESIEEEFSYEQTFEVWDNILRTVGEKIDYIAFQDGTAPINKLEGYLAAIKKVCDKYHIETWSNVELFNRLGGANFCPVEFEVLKYKIKIAKKYSKKLICFEFSHFMSPQSSRESGKRLFKRYKEYYSK